MVFKSYSQAKNSIGIPNSTGFGEWILEIFRKRAREGKTALVWADNGMEISSAELVKNMVQVATGLQEMGAKPGDTMSFVTRNSPEVYYLAFGCMLADVVIAPSVAELNANELRQNFLMVRPRYIVTPPDNIPVVEKAIEQLSPKPQLISLDEKGFKEILAKGSHADIDTFVPAKIQGPNTHVFGNFFSSGTSGSQKAIMITDYPFLKNMYMSSQVVTQNTGFVINPSQIHWMSWMMALTRSVIAGRPLIFLTNTGVEPLLNAIHKYKPTTLFCLGTLVHSLLKLIKKNPGRWDLSSLKVMCLAGDKMSAPLQEYLARELSVDIHQEYGSTEVGIIAQGDVNKPLVPGSAGKPLVPIKLVDLESEEEITEFYKVGEVRVGSAIMAGYRSDPDKTAEAVDKHGWWKLGDLGYFNELNDLFIVDRIKEMFKYKGVQVSPSEIEELLALIPGVSSAAVAGKSDEEVGDLLVAFVVKVPGSTLTENDILAALEKHNLHESKTLRGGVIFVDELPRNPNGKLARRKLADILNGTIIPKSVY